MRKHEFPVKRLRRLASPLRCRKAFQSCRLIRLALRSALQLSNGFGLPPTRCASARSCRHAMGQLTTAVNFAAYLPALSFSVVYG